MRPPIVLAFVLGLAPSLCAQTADLSFATPVIGNCGALEVNGGISRNASLVTRINWQWGDGNSFDNWFPAKYRYYRSGSFTITVRAFIGSQVAATQSISVTVPAFTAACTARPIAEFSLSPPTVTSCGIVSIDGALSKSSAPITRITWQWGNGAVSDGWAPLSYRYAEPGTYTVTVRAFAGADESGFTSFSVTVPPVDAACAAVPVVEFNIGDPVVRGCGQVEIGGGVSRNALSVSRINWTWGDGTTANSWFPASHRFEAPGTYLVTLRLFAAAEELAKRSTVVTIPALAQACADQIYVDPAVISLRGGNTTATLRAFRIAPDGSRRALDPSELEFRSTRSELASVSSEGVVTATGFGDASIEVLDVASGRIILVPVYAGQVSVSPPYARLHMTESPSVQLTVAAYSAAGEPLDLASRRITFSANQQGPDSIARVSSDGVITANRPRLLNSEYFVVFAAVDGVSADSAVLVRTVDDVAGLDFLEHHAGRVAFHFPKRLGNYDNEDVLTRFEVARWTAVAKEFEAEVAGYVLPSSRGGIQYLVNDVGGGPATVPSIPCGGSGFPVQLGSNPNKDVHNSCLIVANPPPLPPEPQWFIIFHELGHNYTFDSRRFSTFSAAGSPNSNVAYIEGFASSTAIYAAERMNAFASQFSIPELVLASILRDAGADHPRWRNALAKYETSGANYSQIDADVVDGILTAFMREFGLDWYFRMSSVFAVPRSPFDFAIEGDSQQATFLVAAAGAAARTDFRPRFAAWGFPIDEAYYNRIFTAVTQLVNTRADPADPPAAVNVILGH